MLEIQVTYFLTYSKAIIGEDLEYKIDQTLEKFGSLEQTITSLHREINNIREKLKAHNEQKDQKFKIYTQLTRSLKMSW